MLPAVSLLCCTYGRTRLLPEVVESFRRQTYQGEMELVIVNDNPEQELICSTPNVTLYTYASRFKNLGEKRNEANKYIDEYSIRIVVDDDDVFLPWFVDEMVWGLNEALTGNEETQYGFYLASHYIGATGVKDAFTCRLKGRGPAGVPAYTRELFEAAGGYPSMNSGQDQALTSRMRKIYKGKNDSVCAPGYLYRWGNGVHHFSGSGAKGTEWDDAQKALFNRTDEPKGDVVIEPRWEIDYIEACRPVLHQWSVETGLKSPLS